MTHDVCSFFLFICSCFICFYYQRLYSLYNDKDKDKKTGRRPPKGRPPVNRTMKWGFWLTKVEKRMSTSGTCSVRSTRTCWKWALIGCRCELIRRRVDNVGFHDHPLWSTGMTACQPAGSYDGHGTWLPCTLCCTGTRLYGELRRVWATPATGWRIASPHDTDTNVQQYSDLDIDL